MEYRDSLDRIREARRYRGQTQAEVASIVGLSQPAYARIETGTAPLSVERAFSILDALHFDRSVLLFDQLSLEAADLQNLKENQQLDILKLLYSLPPTSLEAALKFIRFLSSPSDTTFEHKSTEDTASSP